MRDMVFLNGSLEFFYEGSSTSGLPPFNEHFNAPQVRRISSDIETATVPTTASLLQLPIVGHPTIGSRDVVDMTGGIDVVFYQGGDVEVEGFGGVDLLWFFLSEEAEDEVRYIIQRVT